MHQLECQHIMQEETVGEDSGPLPRRCSNCKVEEILAKHSELVTEGKWSYSRDYRSSDITRTPVYPG